MNQSSPSRLLRTFMTSFSIMDVADALEIHEASTLDSVPSVPTETAEIIGIRANGEIQAYTRAGSSEITPIDPAQVVQDTASLSEVVSALETHDVIFVEILGQVGGVAQRDAVNRPAMRMWLFGMVTLLETNLTNTVLAIFPNDSWQDALSPGRLAKARDLHGERHQRGDNCSLIDCLQLADRADLLVRRENIRSLMGFPSRKAAREMVKNIEKLRNHLAHSQDLLGDWEMIVRLSERLSDLISARRLKAAVAAHAERQSESSET